MIKTTPFEMVFIIRDTMKRLFSYILAAVLFGLVLPWVVTGLVLSGWDDCQPSVRPFLSPGKAVGEPTVLFYKDGEEKQMLLEDYLVGVVLREMPADFEPEAKKAQAVVARTYALYTCESGKHNGGVCGESGCCQGYYEPRDYLADGGSQEAVLEARAAVAATAGQVLTYQGKLIDATYFSCSGGHTEDAAAVWGADIPYLQAVESPGEEGATHFTDTVTFTPEAFCKALGAELSGDPSGWIRDVRYTQGGGVAEMTVGQKSYTGTQLRSLLSLRSTAFSVTAVGSSILITTRGFGHRVGMSQYGADAMAVTGSTYGQILAHYYQGTLLESMEMRS